MERSFPSFGRPRREKVLSSGAYTDLYTRRGSQFGIDFPLFISLLNFSLSATTFDTAIEPLRVYISMTAQLSQTPTGLPPPPGAPIDLY